MYIINAALYNVTPLCTIAIDHALVIVLVEQQQQKTHTFYLPVVETTVTLQDVAVLLGLRIDGGPTITPVMQDLRAAYHELLDLIQTAMHLMEPVYVFCGSVILSALDLLPIQLKTLCITSHERIFLCYWALICYPVNHEIRCNFPCCFCCGISRKLDLSRGVVPYSRAYIAIQQHCSLVT